MWSVKVLPMFPFIPLIAKTIMKLIGDFFYSCVVVTMLCLFASVWFFSQRALHRDLAFALVIDLSSYLLSAPEPTSPLQWGEFENWCKEHSKRKWKANDLEVRFDVILRIENSRPTWKIITKTDELKEYEEALNNKLATFMPSSI